MKKEYVIVAIEFVVMIGSAVVAAITVDPWLWAVAFLSVLRFNLEAL